MKKYAVIVAGGSGSRMKSVLPKQFIELCGKPILMHTLEVFSRFDNELSLIIVLPEPQILFWKELCNKHNFTVSHEVVAGGDARFFSVKNGLDHVPDDSLVAIHDGVRPLVSSETISRCFDTAARMGNAIPCFPVYETVRKVDGDKNVMLDRSNLRLIQTPQIFRSSLIKKAFEQSFDEAFTDDASVLERTGETIYLVDGNRENIKVTDPFDLIIAEAILQNSTN
ncbi:MAG: 2-C-methyl-D-erythritol 4-phosphate cytidylyltransferase [Bacteroidota bacterium]|nr:2-C-methyl-D-erythritol 4-phosphate cytidylyltransferase [Bacteroidota bacterium]